MILEYFDGSSWIVGQPSQGQQYKKTFDSGLIEKGFWNELPIIAPAIRKITKRAFMQRFAQAERIAIRKSVDDIVIDIHEDLKMASIVDLDLQDTINGVAYLGSIGLLTTSQADLLRDGTEDEV
jgi:hypothetical protein